MSEKESGKPVPAHWLGTSSRSRFLALCACVVPLLQGLCADAAQAGAEITRLRADLEWIASPDRGGRAPGSEGSKETRDYIATALTEAGCVPMGNAGATFQPAAPGSLEGHSEIHLSEGATWQTLRLANVFGMLRGGTDVSEGGTAGGSQAPSDPSRTVIVGAHFDHLGQSQGSVYPGADDNASGVAILLEAARVLAQSGPFRNDILFIAFDGEEAGTLGSSHYVGNPIVPLDRTLAMINLDTVGRMQDRRLFALASGTAAEFGDILRGVNLGFGFDLATPVAGSFASDHLPFIEHGVPSLHLSTGANPDYHRTSDTADKIAWDELVETTDFVVELIAFLGNESDPLTFVPPGAERAAAAAPSGGDPRRVSLGTIPDFARESGGVLLTGVMPGSPAEKVGLAKGDIVISLAGTPIDNLADFSAELKAHQPGDEVTVEVMRNGAKIAHSVTLVERSSR